MSGFNLKDNIWPGVRNGVLQQISAWQRAVADDGSVQTSVFSSSVALGDLNGDGLLDLVVADPRGYFWFYPNNGNKTEPKFTTGEIIPLWLGEVPDGLTMYNPIGEGLDDIAPRIALVDFNGDKKLDLVVGNYVGKLFYIPNTGSSTQPNFSMSGDITQLQTVKTRADSRLWVNFLSPCLYDWFGTGVLDLIMGDGGYSANSIFLLKNRGSSAQPTFTEDQRIRIIPGVGREQLTPTVVDWNHDGKPDILTGERTGAVEIFLNTSEDQKQPTFGPGQKVSFGGQDKFGNMTTVAVGPLSGNPLTPDVVIADDSNHLYYAKNTGTVGKPLFATRPAPLKGVNPAPKILVPNAWCLGNGIYRLSIPSGVKIEDAELNGYSLGGPYGVPYETLAITNPQQEPGFELPKDVSWKNVLHYFVYNPQNKYFPGRYYPKNEDKVQAHGIRYTAGRPELTSETDYTISFWIKSSGVHDLGWQFTGRDNDDKSEDYKLFDFGNAIPVDSSWRQVKDTVNWKHHYAKDHVTTSFVFYFIFYGQGDIQIADVHLTKAK